MKSVSQEEYARVVAERDELKKEVDELKDEVSDLHWQLDALCKQMQQQ